MIDGALASENPWLQGITRERLEQEGHVRLNFAASAPTAGSESSLQASDVASSPFLPFAQGNFRTPSGKAELYSEAMKALGLDPVAEFSPSGRIAARNPAKEVFPSNCSRAKPTTS